MTKRQEKLLVRVAPEIKVAVQKAADDDRRSLSSYVEKLLADVMAERSYLSTAKREQANG